jgi:putative DNA primase/helicase
LISTNIMPQIEKKINIDAIPIELKTFDQWLCWRALPKDGKITKVPFDAKNGDAGSSTNPETWTSFDTALAAYQNGNYNGIGFALENAGLVGVDLDHCRDSETGELEAWAEDIVKRLNSYTEITPSSKGLRIFLYGEIKNPGRKKGKTECYDSGRFLTVTGQHLEGSPKTIEHRQDEFDLFHAGVFGNTKKPQAPLTVVSDLDETEIIQRAINAKNGENFRRLYAGDWSGYPSQSEADLAFCNLLAFWTGRDPAKMESIFRTSDLYREKAAQHYSDGSNYLSRTIAKAIDGTSEIYQAMKDFETREIAADYNLTDVGNGHRFADMWRGQFRFNYLAKAGLFYDGIRWVQDDVGKIRELAKETALEIYKEAARTSDPDRRKALASHAVRSESEARLDAMISLAESEPGIPVLPKQLDANQWLLNVSNGTIDLTTGKLLPHKSEDLITKLAPAEFDIGASCPMWTVFLDEIMQGNNNLIDFIQRACGYALTGDTSEQVLFILHGSGANGKTVFSETISHVLGDYALSTPMTTFLAKRGDAIPNDVAGLHGARFVSASEAERGSRLAEALVKKLTGGDKISARKLHQEFFEFTPQFKAFLSTNHKPSIEGTDYAIWRRIRLIPFGYTIPEYERDLHLAENLKEESSGILMWLLTGCLKWQRIGLGAPDEVLQATDTYRAEMDVLAGFISECCTVQGFARAPVGELYKEYCEWAERNGEKPLTQRKLTTQLVERGFMSSRGTGGYYYLKGIGILSEFRQSNSEGVK